jgi:hypothetical protein
MVRSRMGTGSGSGSAPARSSGSGSEFRLRLRLRLRQSRLGLLRYLTLLAALVGVRCPVPVPVRCPARDYLGSQELFTQARVSKQSLSKLQ